MHPKAKEERWGPGKDVQQQIQSLLRKGYKVVGKMDSNGTWTSDHFSYPSQPIITVGTGAGVPLSERYPLSDAVRHGTVLVSQLFSADRITKISVCKIVPVLGSDTRDQLFKVVLGPISLLCSTEGQKTPYK